MRVEFEKLSHQDFRQVESFHTNIQHFVIKLLFSNTCHSLLPIVKPEKYIHVTRHVTLKRDACDIT